MAKKKIKVLFFIAGMRATDAEDAAMNKFSNRHVVCIRNAQYVGDNDAIEDFDEVAGEVPAIYAEAAALKPKPKKEPKPAPVDPKTVDANSPAAPQTPVPGAPAGQEGNQGGGAGDLKPEDANPAGAPPSASEAAVAEAAKPVEGAGDAKPKAPEAKPGAGKGWKPNA